MDVTTLWFALQTEPRSEKKVDRLLAHKGYERFLPTYQQKRRWSDRVVTTELPLFPGYIFCRFNSSAFGKAISTPGVSRIVSFGGRPAEVLSSEIEALQLLVKSSLLREPWVYIPSGTRIQVETGPLTGVEGIVCPDDGKRRLIISVTLLQRSVAVHLDDQTLVSVIDGPKEHGNVPRHERESEIWLQLVKRVSR